MDLPDPILLVTYTLIFLSLYFQVFLLLTFVEKRKVVAKEEGRLPSSYPSVTIVVPCFNEERTVAKTLNSLLALNYPKNRLSIIAIDDGSTDNTWNALERFRKNSRITMFKKENGGKHTALNLALEHTTTELVGCLDADSLVLPEALLRIIPYFEDKEVMAVTPAIKINNPQNLISKLQYVEYIVSIFVRKMLGLMDAIQVTPGPFSIFRTEVFRKIGGYRKAHNTEDMEMALRLHKHHYKIANAHEAIVLTNPPQTLRGLYRQRLRWTYGFMKNAVDYREMFLRPKYGNLAMFTLPAAVVSIFSVIYYTSYLLWKAGQAAYGKVVEISVVGFMAPSFSLSWEWLFSQYQATIMLSIILIFLGIIVIMAGGTLVRERGFPRGFFAYLALYGFIVPIWLWGACINFLRSHQSSWR